MPMGQLFANDSHRTEQLCVSSTKSSIGHLLGAAGAVESIFTILAIKNSIIPPTLNLNDIGGHKADETKKFGEFNYVPNKSLKKLINYGLCNSFGFEELTVQFVLQGIINYEGTNRLEA